MATFSKYFPHLLIWEGGFVNDKDDKGGATKYGVTLKEWIASGYDEDKDGDIDVNDLKRITPADAEKIAKKRYWDKIKGDDIKSQSVAEFLADWAYNSGSVTAIKMIQECLTLKEDGIIGPKTLAAINKANSFILFNQLKVRRVLFFERIVKNNPSQKKFLKGWKNRVNSFQYKA